MQGSLVTAERLRFDFNLHRGLSPKEISEVEALVNGWISEDTQLTTREMPLAEAKAAGDPSLFKLLAVVLLPSPDTQCNSKLASESGYISLLLHPQVVLSLQQLGM